jgi:hypothetical protein
MKLEFSQRFLEKKLKYKISSKSVQWELSYCMRTDGRTDRQTDMTLIIALWNLAKAPNNGNFMLFYTI